MEAGDGEVIGEAGVVEMSPATSAEARQVLHDVMLARRGRTLEKLDIGIGRVVARLRVEQNREASDLARALGVWVWRYRRLEAGRAAWSLRALIRVSDALTISIDELLHLSMSRAWRESCTHRSGQTVTREMLQRGR